MAGINYEDKANWMAKEIEQNPDFANNLKGDADSFTKKVINSVDYRDGDLNDYDFGDSLVKNDRGGYDWTDSNGNKHSLYKIKGNRLGSYHSVTDSEGNVSTWYQNGSVANSYIRALNAAAKKAKAGKKKDGLTDSIKTSISEAKKTTPEKSVSQSGGNNETKTSVTEKSVSQPDGNNETKTSVTEKPGLPVGLDKSDDLNEIRKEINALEMSKWDDSNPYARQRYQQLVNKAADHPDADSNDKDKAELVNTAWNLNNKKLYVSPYDEMRHSSEQRKAIEKSLKGGEGKERRLMGIIPSFLLGEYGNYKRSKIDKDEIYPIVSPEGKTIGYMDKKDAEWYVNKENKKLGENDKKFSIGPKETTHYRISDGDTTYYFDDEQSAKDKKKEIDKTNQPERLKAWGEFIYRLMNSISTNDMNLSSDLSGNGRPYQSIQQKDMESRLQGNNEMYYKNEMAKNDNIRKFVELADAGIINLNTLSNEQIATLGALIGKERVQQLISIAGKQEVQYIAATQMYKNWDKNQRDIYTKWLVTEGSGPANETFLSYANGELSASDLAKRYRMQLAKGGLEIKAVEEAVRKAGLENRMTQAQVDVIKELVAEQLKAAKLTNNQRIQEMATSSVDTFAKLIDAVLPG